MPALRDAFVLSNLERAWSWIKSNPDPNYKRFCRAQYSTFAISEETLLELLSEKLRTEKYEPTHASKFLIPKKTGILRPYSILTVEDQIVYQALTNIVAERLAPKIRSRYMTHTFGHMYAGSSSPWFYKKWTDGYAAFNKTARRAFKTGLKLAASFDLTACYDSLDHRVLCHFLKKLKIEDEFCKFLTTGLGHWTATDERIYQSHGIPQGPLSSGLISEVVLQHFDQNSTSSSKVLYMRYVDDIRLFAKNESELRRLLIRLDQLSKDVGLFPQTAKIDIHEVKDIEDELKSVSNPTDAALSKINASQEEITKRIIELSPRLNPTVKIENETRFKFLVAHVRPSHRHNTRFLQILEGRPDLAPSLMRYFMKYQELPKSAAQALVARLNRGELYDAVAAEIVRCLTGRTSPAVEKTVIRAAKKLWRPRGGSDLASAVGTLLILKGGLTLRQTEYALRKAPDWFVRTKLTQAMNLSQYGSSVLDRLLNERLRDGIGDVSLAAAERLALNSLKVFSPYKDINPQGGKLLRSFGVIKKAPGAGCGIEMMFSTLGNKISVNWKSVFGSDYRQAERQALRMKGLAPTDISSFVNAADVFNDLFISNLYKHDPSLGAYGGNIGGILNSTRLKSAYPRTQALCLSIHETRLESDLSHPKVKSTGRPTGPIRFSYLKNTAKPLYRSFCYEVDARW